MNRFYSALHLLISRPLSIWCFCLALWAPNAARAEQKVLFIGNSYTYGDHGTTSVAKMFDQLAQAGGHGDPTTDMSAVGGVNFKFHDSHPETLAKIKSQPWDYVILQDYSTEPTHLQDGIHSVADFLKYGTSLYEKILANNPKTKVILYETWSRPVANTKFITGKSTPTSFASTAEMQSELRQNYQKLADTLNAAHPRYPPVQIAPVGDAWEEAGALLPSTKTGFTSLFFSDNWHGNDDGYYLAAAVIYSKIYGESPLGLSLRSPVTALHLVHKAQTSFLENAAWKTVKTTPAAGKVTTR